MVDIEQLKQLDQKIKKVKEQKASVLVKLENLAKQKLSRKVKKAKREPLQKEWQRLWDELKELYAEKKELLAKSKRTKEAKQVPELPKGEQEKDKKSEALREREKVKKEIEKLEEERNELLLKKEKYGSLEKEESKRLSTLSQSYIDSRRKELGVLNDEYIKVLGKGALSFKDRVRYENEKFKLSKEYKDLMSGKTSISKWNKKIIDTAGKGDEMSNFPRKFPGAEIEIFSGKNESTKDFFVLTDAQREDYLEKYEKFLEKKYGKLLTDFKEYWEGKSKPLHERIFNLKRFNKIFSLRDAIKEDVQPLTPSDIRDFMIHAPIGESEIILTEAQLKYLHAITYQAINELIKRGRSENVLNEMGGITYYYTEEGFFNFFVQWLMVSLKGHYKGAKDLSENIYSDRHTEVKKSKTFSKNPSHRITSVEVEMEGGNAEKLKDINKTRNNLELDGSIPEYGVEYQISMANGDLLFDEIDRAYKELREAGYTHSQSEGLHTHHDTADFSEKDYKNLIGILKDSEDFIYSLNPISRQFSKYSTPATRILKDPSRSKADSIDMFYQKDGRNHHSGLNLEWITSTSPRVEFRYGAATDDPELAKAFTILYNSMLDKAKVGSMVPDEVATTTDFIEWLDIPKKYSKILKNQFDKMEEVKGMFIVTKKQETI